MSSWPGTPIISRSCSTEHRRSSRRGGQPACADRSQAHQYARHSDVRSSPLQIKSAPPTAFGCRRPGVELKKLTLSRYQRVAAPTARQVFEITCFSDRHFWHEDDDKAYTCSGIKAAAAQPLTGFGP